MAGLPGGLLRIDRLFGGNGYNAAFTASPLVFGAFPSLHSACACLEALFLSHFFPHTTRYVWAYTGLLFWSTMYMTHHYLIDVVGGSCLAVAAFYLLLPEELKGAAATAPPGGVSRLSKYALYDIPENERSHAARDYDFGDSSERESDEEVDITYRSPLPPVPGSATPLMRQGASSSSGQQKKSHKHTASIASLIRSEDRGDDGWSPVAGSFNLPPTPTQRP